MYIIISGGTTIWIGIDDTDSRKGGCTTHLAWKLVENLNKHDLDIIGYPRLVRLNPNIPWKTRGNGAVSIRIGKGQGAEQLIGHTKDKKIVCFEKGKKIENKDKSLDLLIDITKKTLKNHARLNDENTNSGFVIFDKKPVISFYRKAVKSIVSIEESLDFLDKNAVFYKGYKNKRGVIGATGAVSWEPKNDRTYELIAYRPKDRWGKKRAIEDESAKEIDKIFTSTFDNFDYKNNHNRLVPSSPCPVLYGIRGDNNKELIEAKYHIKSEKAEGWLLFKSNQGTDDHLQEKNVNKIQRYDSVIVRGEVYKKPITIKGGHVIFSIRDTTGSIDCAGYEPTKEFRDILRNLIVGDEVKLYGGVRKKPLTINLEKIKVINLSNKIIKVENPVCPKCGKHMKSIGKEQGYKCKKCGIKSYKEKMRRIDRRIKTGLYEVPVCARRHLSKPLKRIDLP